MRTFVVGIFVAAILGIAGFAYYSGYPIAAALFVLLDVVLVVLTRNFRRGIVANDPLADEWGGTMRNLDE